MKLFFKRLQHEGVRRFCRSLRCRPSPPGSSAARQKHETCGSCNRRGWGLVNGLHPMAKQAVKAWRGEIYIHGRAGIRPSMADGEMWAPALQEMRMGTRSAELRDRNEARFARSAAPRGCSRLDRGVRAWTGPAEASAGAPAPNVSQNRSATNRPLLRGGF